jgi:putative spermidine/putrescine transport system substrate-binding protein/spermidine/putrescine transport system substrate-binding protein
MTDTRTSRRRLLAAGTALGIGLALAAPAQAEEGVLRIFTFEGYTDDAWVEEFEAATGADVRVTYTGSVDEMFAKMRGSEGEDYDLVSLDTSGIPRYLEHGLLAPIDTAQVANMANLLPAFQHVPEVQVDGQVYGVPIAWGSLGLIYDNEAFAGNPPTSWGVMWDPAYDRRILVLDDANNNIVNTAIYLGFDNPYDLTDEQFAEVRAKLIEQKALVQTYYAGFEDGVEIWESSDAVLMFSMGEFQQVGMAERGLDVTYIIPAEGGVGWLDCWVMSKGVGDEELALAWIDFFLEKKIGQAMSAAYGYGNTTSETEGLDYAGKLNWLQPPEDFERRVEVWNEVKATQ